MSNLFIVLVGAAGSGKGDIAPLTVLIKEKEHELEQQYREEMRAYQKQQAQLGRTNGKKRGKDAKLIPVEQLLPKPILKLR